MTPSATVRSGKMGGECSRPICSRSKARPKATAPGTITSWSPPRRPRRRSGPCPRAGARSFTASLRKGRAAGMMTIFGYSAPLLFGQLLLGLINGAFYALLSLGLAIIFGMLNIINFAHGALYMVGAFGAWFLLQCLGIGYWPALIIAPVAVG